jgi:alanyl-tRNA synthetase
MQKTSLEIRQAFFDYFKRHGHTQVASSSLIPENDPTLLFANAGMNQFKNAFLGLENRGYTRAVTSQKCVRAGGKHNDLDNVGFTARHHTFFEMLGNFSFGDYFKKDAIHFGWEFLTKDLQIPKEKLYVTVHLSDDEAADIWHKQEGTPRDRIFRFDKDNFWKMGDVGPCGPCSEIFYDHGSHAGREADPFKGIAAGEDRYVEIWNLVFMQFYEKSPGVMDPLPKPSVDTGSGLERVTAALQGKLNNYDTDLFWPLIQRAADISKKQNLFAVIEQMNREGVHAKVTPEQRQQVAAMRVVADHARSCAFLIADGALPSNEGRGYVLRRILRRAVRFSNMLSDGKPFLPEICESVIEKMGGVYPELRKRGPVIMSTIKEEQERFMATLGTGQALLSEELARLKRSGKSELPGDVAFKLYDTFGFPSDLTRLIVQEQGFRFDEQQFEQSMNVAKDKARGSFKGKALQLSEGHLLQFVQGLPATKFTGYESLQVSDEKVLALSTGTNAVDTLQVGESGLVVVAKTPFYAEGGGQVGDKGQLSWAQGQAHIMDTTKAGEVYVHHIQVVQGALSKGISAQLQVTASDRRDTASNHSATHLLHSALRKVLGDHVTQAGSSVDPVRLRFDFTHNKALNPQEIQQVENLVNEQIALGETVQVTVTSHKEALAMGAMALFGEKYGDQVRVLKMGSFSTELCGGTHVQNTAQIRLFKIVVETGVSAGIRRIEALTGNLALQYMQKHVTENLKARTAAGLNENWQKFLESTEEVSNYIEIQKSSARALEKELKKSQGSQVDVDKLAAAGQSFQSKGQNAQFVFADLPLSDRDVLAQVVDQIKNKIQSGCVIVVGQGESGASGHPIVVSVTRNLNPELSAGQLLKEVAAIMGGKGGGRPDFAQGAAPDRSQLSAAKKKAQDILGLS